MIYPPLGEWVPRDGLGLFRTSTRIHSKTWLELTKCSVDESWMPNKKDNAGGVDMKQVKRILLLLKFLNRCSLLAEITYLRSILLSFSRYERPLIVCLKSSATYIPQGLFLFVYLLLLQVAGLLNCDVFHLFASRMISKSLMRP